MLYAAASDDGYDDYDDDDATVTMMMPCCSKSTVQPRRRQSVRGTNSSRVQSAQQKLGRFETGRTTTAKRRGRYDTVLYYKLGLEIPEALKTIR